MLHMNRHVWGKGGASGQDQGVKKERNPKDREVRGNLRTSGCVKETNTGWIHKKGGRATSNWCWAWWEENAKE